MIEVRDVRVRERMDSVMVVVVVVHATVIQDVTVHARGQKMTQVKEDGKGAGLEKGGIVPGETGRGVSVERGIIIAEVWGIHQSSFTEQNALTFFFFFSRIPREKRQNTQPIAFSTTKWYKR